MVYFAKSLTGDSRSALGTDIPTYDAWMAGSNSRDLERSLGNHV